MFRTIQPAPGWARKENRVATFRVRQHYDYYEDFIVEAEDVEDAVQLVNDGQIAGLGNEYVDTTANFLVSTNPEDGGSPLDEQPDNAYGY